MLSCLYLAAPQAEQAALLRRLREHPALATLSNLRLCEMLTVEADYPTEAIADALTAAGIAVHPTLPIGDDIRFLPLTAARDDGTALLLRSAGIEAIVERQPIVSLCGIGDEQFRRIRDLLLAAPAVKVPADEIPPLPADAGEGFAALSDEERIARAAVLGLALPDDCLHRIAAYYRDSLRRDPMPDELRILDEAYRQACANPAVCAPVALRTNDPRAHTLYADLMEKHRALVPAATTPPTLMTLAGIASRYLCAHRSQPLPLSRRICGRPDETDFQLTASGAVSIGGFADADGQCCCQLAAAPIANASPEPGDRLLWLPATPNDAAALRTFFASDAARCVRRSLAVKRGTLIAAIGRVLGKTGFGMRIFPDENACRSPADRLTPDEDGVLIVCDGNAGSIIPAALQRVGLPFTVLAAVTREAVITTGTAGKGICLPAAMFAPRPAVTADIHRPDIAAESPEALPLARLAAELASSAARVGVGYDPTLAAHLAQRPTDSVCCDRELVCALCCAPQHDPLGEVRDAALNLVARLIAAGAQPDQITLSLTAELPMQNAAAVGASLAALLGLYWVQIELGIVSECPNLRPGKQLRIYLAATAPEGTAAPLPVLGQTLYLLSPRSTEGRLNGEYALFCAASVLRHTHHVAPLAGLSPAAAAARTADRAGLGLMLAVPSDIAFSPSPAGLLLSAETEPQVSESIAVCAIGRLTDTCGVTFGGDFLDADRLTAAACGTLPAPIPVLHPHTRPPRLSACRFVRPRLLLPYTGLRPDAMHGAIVRLGGEPLFFPLDFRNPETARRSLSDLAEQLDGAQILLLNESIQCSSALLTHRRTAEALNRFLVRDGLFAAAGEAFAALLACGILLPEATTIPVRTLTGITCLCTEIVSASSPWVASLKVGDRRTAVLPRPASCPDLTPDAYRSLLAAGNVISVAAGTPDGRPAVTAIASPDGNLIGQSIPVSTEQLASAIAYFA